MNVAEIAVEILKALENGWNNADGGAFAQPFAAVSDFVDIRGTLHASIAPDYVGKAHDELFAGIYHGSRIRYELAQVAVLGNDLLLAHVITSLSAPTGPLSGMNNSVVTMLLQRRNDLWKIRAFHNTLVFNPARTS